MQNVSGRAMPRRWTDGRGWDNYYVDLIASGAAADRWDFNLGSFGGERFGQIVGELRAGGCRRIWVAGCGCAPLGRLLAMAGFEVVASDVARVAIAFQREVTGHLEEGVARLQRARGEHNARHPERELGDFLKEGGIFEAVVHDFRKGPPGGAFDVVFNQKALQGFGTALMFGIAEHHAAALRPGGYGVFDTINVQGELRDTLEGALVSAGFHVPLFEAKRWHREVLRETGIGHVFVLGMPHACGSEYQDGKTREEANAVLRGFQAEYEARARAEWERSEGVRNDGRTRHATVIYSTG